MRTRSIAPLLVAVLSLAASPVAAQEGDGDDGIQRYAGTWRYAHSADHGTRIIHRAVDRCVEPENIFVRPIAAGRLRGKNQLVRSIQITINGQNVTVVFDGSRTYRGTLGSWRRHTFDGESINVQFRYRNGDLVQLFRSDSGTRRNVYHLTGEGRMRLSVTVQANALERDMRYQLDYRR